MVSFHAFDLLVIASQAEAEKMKKTSAG